MALCNTEKISERVWIHVGKSEIFPPLMTRPNCFSTRFNDRDIRFGFACNLRTFARGANVGLLIDEKSSRRTHSVFEFFESFPGDFFAAFFLRGCGPARAGDHVR